MKRDKIAAVIAPMGQHERVVFSDGQHGRVVTVLSSKEGPMCFIRADSGAKFTAKHCEVRRENRLTS